MLARGVRLEPDADGKPVAAGEVLVRVLKDASSRPELLERTTRELQVTSLLASHPLVLKYHDVDLIGNRYCIITDYVPHPSLERLLLARQRLPYPAVLAVLKALVSLLAAAQANGLVERQIHLEDLLVDPATGDSKLVKLSTPRSLTVKGSVQRRSGAASLVGDAYFLGCTLFRLLTLEHAFSALQNSETVAQSRLSDGVKSSFPSMSAAEVERIVQLFTRLTTRDLSQHFASLDEVARELEDLEALNADILKARTRADTFQRRARKTKLTETAYDTVAAFRGDLQAPRDDAGPPVMRGPRVSVPVEDPDPAMKGAATLLWGRQGVDGAATMNWDDPLVVRMITTGAVGLFFAMLLWLLFSH